MNGILERYTDKELLQYLESIHLPNKVINELISNGLVKKIKNKVLFNLSEYDKNDVTSVYCPLNIVYEDNDIIVIKKERGILIHSNGNRNDTLLNGVSYYLEAKGETLKVRCVHRIDVDTIGLVLFSKNIISYYDLFYQMNNNLIKKKYYAILEGKVESGEVIAKIGKNRHKNNAYLVTKTGKSAKTLYELIEYKDDRSLVSVTLITGRRHQIRVHMAYIGHPIVGDEIYGHGGELMLENYYLKFISPNTQEELEIKIDNELEW